MSTLSQEILDELKQHGINEVVFQELENSDELRCAWRGEKTGYIDFDTKEDFEYFVSQNGKEELIKLLITNSQ